MISGGIFNLGNDNFYCIHCKSKNLDGKPCVSGKSHEVDKEILDRATNEKFENFVNSIIINEEERKNIGTISSESYISDEITSKELIETMRSKTEIRKILNDYFPLETFDDLKKKRDNDAAIERLSGKRKKDRIHELFFSNKISVALSSSTTVNFVYNPDYRKFIRDDFFPTINNFLNNEKYSQYVKFFIGEEPKFETAEKIYNDLIRRKIEESNVYMYFTYDIVFEILNFEIIVEKLKEPECLKYFIGRLRNLKNSEEIKFAEHINFLKQMIKMKLMRKNESSCYVPSFENSFNSEYMKNIIGIQTNSYNFCYDFDITEFIMMYKSKIMKNDFYYLSQRDVTHETSEYREVKKLLDFKNYFHKIKIGDGIVQVVYKKGTDEIYASQERTMRIDLSYGDFFGVYFDDGSNIIIDILTEEAFFEGTGKSIKKNISQLKKFDIDFEKPTFVSFSGKMSVTTSGILLKKILPRFFVIPELRNFWHTKSQVTSTNNHSFVYWPEDMKNIPAISKESVDFNIIFQSKINIITNKWEIVFNGNQNSFIIPFFSMFLSLVHLMENLKHNKKYETVNNEIEKFLLHYKRKNQENNRKLSDTATILVSQNEIAKRETYNRAIRSSIGDEKIIESFNSRSKPIVFPMERFSDSKIVERWKLFYQGIMLNTSPIFSIDCDKKYDSSRSSRYDIFYNDSESQFQISGFGNVGVMYRNIMFLSYPEKDKLPLLTTKVNGPPTKSSVINVTDGKIFSQKYQGLSSRKKNVTPTVQGAINQFTDTVPMKSGFYFPMKKGFSGFREFINANYPVIEERHALVYQHMWDYSPEEIEKSFEKIDITLHQDLLQNYHQAMIFYLEHDTIKKTFDFKEPRNRFGYFRNTTYKNAMFIFKMSQDRMDVIYFNDKDDFIHIDSKIRNFIKTEKSNVSFTASEIISLLRGNEKIEGQFFDTNGKSVGIRIKRDEQVMDLRYPAQFSIYERTGSHRFHKLTTTETNVTEKFGNFSDSRFTLIPMKTKSVKYQVSKIHQKTKNWRKDVYFFVRTFISYWLIMSTDNEKIYTNDEVNDFVDSMLEISDGRKYENQMIDNLAVIQNFSDIQKYTAYLEKIFPNRFYNGKFHVDECEIEKIKEYMKAEISPIKNCPPSFKQMYLSARVDSSLLEKSSLEISGINAIFYNNMISSLKENNMSEDRFLFTENFSPLYDFNHQGIHPKKKKAEMLLIPYRNKFFFIRMTERGHFPIAVHACDLWFKKKQIASYYTKEEKNISSARKFKFENDRIIESKGNEEEIIKLSGEDYWVLAYNLKNGAIAYAAMLPVEIN